MMGHKTNQENSSGMSTNVRASVRVRRSREKVFPVASYIVKKDPLIPLNALFDIFDRRSFAGLSISLIMK